MLERKEIGQNGIEIKIPAEQDGTTYIFVLENEGDIFRSAISRDPEDNITILTTDYSFKTELTVAFILFIPDNSDRYKFNAIRINSTDERMEEPILKTKDVLYLYISEEKVIFNGSYYRLNKIIKK